MDDPEASEGPPRDPETGQFLPKDDTERGHEGATDEDVDDRASDEVDVASPASESHESATRQSVDTHRERAGSPSQRGRQTPNRPERAGGHGQPPGSETARPPGGQSRRPPRRQPSEPRSGQALGASGFERPQGGQPPKEGGPGARPGFTPGTSPSQSRADLQRQVQPGGSGAPGQPATRDARQNQAVVTGSTPSNPARGGSSWSVVPNQPPSGVSQPASGWPSRPPTGGQGSGPQPPMERVQPHQQPEPGQPWTGQPHHERPQSEPSQSGAPQHRQPQPTGQPQQQRSFPGQWRQPARQPRQTEHDQGPQNQAAGPPPSTGQAPQRAVTQPVTDRPAPVQSAPPAQPPTAPEQPPLSGSQVRPADSTPVRVPGANEQSQPRQPRQDPRQS